VLFQYTLRAKDGAKMPSNVEKWQNWGLVSAHKVMLDDPHLCTECRQIIWAFAKAWRIEDQLIERMFHVEDISTND
jgi:hypothetical protein